MTDEITIYGQDELDMAITDLDNGDDDDALFVVDLGEAVILAEIRSWIFDPRKSDRRRYDVHLYGNGSPVGPKTRGGIRVRRAIGSLKRKEVDPIVREATKYQGPTPIGYIICNTIPYEYLDEVQDILDDYVAQYFSESLNESLNESDVETRKVIDLCGLRIAIEHPAGSTKSGRNGFTGERWTRKYSDHYGHIIGREGIDGDSLDCYVRVDPDVDCDVYVVTQMKFDGDGVDEEKVMLGYSSEREAKQAFVDHCPNPKDMFGGIEKMGQEEFAEKLKRTKDGEPVVAMEKLTGRPIRGFLDWESAYGWKDSLPSPVAALYELQGTIGKKTIVEHISAGDLEHIVLPLISCDEYTPKDDESNIVFAFFVRGVPEAVEPLRRVIERCPGVVLADSGDSDTLARTSIVYSEFVRKTFDISDIEHMVGVVSRLSKIDPDEFSMKFPGIDDLFEYNPDSLNAYVSAIQRDAEKAERAKNRSEEAAERKDLTDE